MATEYLRAVDGRPLLSESRRMLEYLEERARTLTVTDIRDRIEGAALELESVVSTVGEHDIRRRPFPGKWHIADVVDHISQTQIRGAEELRHLMSERRPPGPPVYEALKSGASEWAPWPSLVQGLKDANREMLSVINENSKGLRPNPEPESSAGIIDPTACTIVVANCKVAEGQGVPQIFVAELNWKQYALLQRLHLLDHRTQIRRLLKALGSDSGSHRVRDGDC